MIAVSAALDLKQKIGSRFGKNKTEELFRLLYEIGRRESKDPEEVLEQTLRELNGHDKAEGSVSIADIHFSKL